MKRFRAERFVQAENVRKPVVRLSRVRRSDCVRLWVSAWATKEAREDGAKGDGNIEHEARMTTGRAWFMAS